MAWSAGVATTPLQPVCTTYMQGTSTAALVALQSACVAQHDTIHHAFVAPLTAPVAERTAPHARSA
jgi:hypothetical protein